MLLARVETFIRENDLIEPGGAVCCLVSGGADSTCLWHALGALGYRVSAVHVNHMLRGDESDADARFCADALGAEVVELDGRGLTEAELRAQRYSVARDRLRATGHTASDQVETILFRLVSRGAATGMAPRRDDSEEKGGGGVVHPLLAVWRDEAEAYCTAAGLAFRIDRSNFDTKRGLIRHEILPLLRRLHPDADANLLRALDRRETLPPELAELLASPAGSKRVDLGGGLQAVREYDRLWLERGPVDLAGEVRWGAWRIRARTEGLKVRGWRAGDRLAGRRKKIQDLFVDAKIPRSEREAWPLVVRGDEVVAVPGIVEHPDVEYERD
jgi:tRNA(Ile)-lysidine synthetase-like protein